MSRDHGAIRGKRHWVVGASSGIGAALAHELVRRGGEVAISARSADDLAAVAQGRMVTEPVDATDRDAVIAAAARLREQWGTIDVVHWSAGFWDQMPPGTWDADLFARHVEVNLLGLNNLLAAVLPTMIDDRRGHLVGIASVAGYRGLAGAEAYGATKAAQLNLLESLRGAFTTSGLRITTVSPGFVRTPMTETNEFPMPFIIEAEDAAKAICDGIERHRVEIVFPLPMAVAMKSARLVPNRLWTRLTRRSR